MPADPVPLTGRVNAFEVAKTRRSRSFVLVEQLQELGIEVPEHRPGQRHGHFRVRIRGTRSHEQAVGDPHRRIVAGPRSPAPTRRGAQSWRPVDCPRGTGALRPEDAAAPPPGRGRRSHPLRRLGSRARGRPVLDRDTSAEATDAPRGHGYRRGAAARRQLIRSNRCGLQISTRWRLTVVCHRPWERDIAALLAVSGISRIFDLEVADEASTFEELLATTAASGGNDMALIYPGDIWARDAVTQLADALNDDGVAYRRRGLRRRQRHARRAPPQARVSHPSTSCTPTTSAARWRSLAAWCHGYRLRPPECRRLGSTILRCVPARWPAQSGTFPRFSAIDVFPPLRCPQTHRRARTTLRRHSLAEGSGRPSSQELLRAPFDCTEPRGRSRRRRSSSRFATSLASFAPASNQSTVRGVSSYRSSFWSTTGRCNPRR